jgi:SAM-dependent methyltransferase
MLNKYINILENKIKQLPNSQSGLHLHLGCGPKFLAGFVNMDAYHEDSNVIKHDYSKGLPFASNSVDSIYSSHSLEHLPHRRAVFAIQNWYSVLKVGGKVYLAVPDLEVIMSKILDPSVKESDKDWFYYCLFGYQTSSEVHWNNKNLDLPIDPGQFHTTGFTMKRLEYLFALNKFKIEEMFAYDGWGTPSIYLETIKM